MEIETFYKPIIILSAPRSGSTLLFEILTNGKNVWSIGDESHQAIESIPELNIYNNNLSNRLTDIAATQSVANKLRKNFFDNLIDRNNNQLDTATTKQFRFIEKTPKNTLRIPFLNAVFPDAYFIFLVRSPCETVSSMIEAWKSGKWITYQRLPEWQNTWSLLLPPGWQALKSKNIEEYAAFQWKAANDYVLQDLKSIPSHRITTITYEDLVNKTEAEIKRICEFCEIEYDDTLCEVTKNKLSYSKYTLTAPSKEKWKKNYFEIANVYKSLKVAINKVNKYVNTDNSNPSMWRIEDIKFSTNRNASCPCGSGKKFKHCHSQ